MARRRVLVHLIPWFVGDGTAYSLHMRNGGVDGGMGRSEALCTRRQGSVCINKEQNVSRRKTRLGKTPEVGVIKEAGSDF